jgi:hypothetical protein
VIPARLRSPEDAATREQEARRPPEPAAPLALAATVGNRAFGALLGRTSAAPAPATGRPAAASDDAALARGLAEAAEERTRNPVGAGPTEDEDVTANGDAGTDAGTRPAANCSVASGPTYTPSGTVPLVRAGGRKSAPFSMAATFATTPGSGATPRCCSVRQYIKWDKAYQDDKGGPPHGGFPSSASFGTWYEDRDASDKRYGHRSGPHSDPIAGGDEYLTAGTRDQANGDTYVGTDEPGAPDSRKGQFQFQLKVIDTCNGDAVKASSSVITVQW